MIEPSSNIQWDNLLAYSKIKELTCKYCDHLLFKTKEKATYDCDLKIFTFALAPEVVGLHSTQQFCGNCKTFVGDRKDKKINVFRFAAKLTLSDQNDRKFLTIS